MLITFDLSNYDYITKQGAKFKIEAKDLIRDVNLDGKVDINDAALLQKYLAEIENLTDNQKIAADVNGDGEITVSDAILIQKAIAGYSV